MKGQDRMPIVRADQLQSPLARLLRPLVRLLVRSGVTFPALADLLRELYVNVAEHEFTLSGKEQTDSRVSLLTGIHRKEVRRLRGAGTPISPMPAAVSRSSLILARWLGGPRTVAADGQPLPLPRQADRPDTPSFDALVASVTRDVRPRAVLDELLAQGLVTIDAQERIVLTEGAFVPRTDGEAIAYYFGRNLHDHIAAAVANLAEGPRYFERAVHYDELTQRQAELFEEMSRRLAGAALTKANREALSVVDAPDAEQGQWRWTFGVYIYREDAGARTEQP
jgi:hypothetical protein